jgi:hypothetical protein
LESFWPIVLAIKLAFLTEISALYAEKDEHNIGFQ